VQNAAFNQITNTQATNMYWLSIVIHLL